MLAVGTTLARGRDNDNNDERRGPPPSAEDFIKRLDKDGDGKVSKTEFDGPDEHFTQFDKDGDGYITESEVPTTPPDRDNDEKGGERGSRGGRR